MARRRSFRNSLAAGEVGEEFLQSTEEELNATAASTLLNVFVTNSRGCRRRPGTVPMSIPTISGTTRVEVFDLSGDQVKLLGFSDEALEIFDEDGVYEDDIAAPWAAEDIADIYIANGDDRFYIFGNFTPQILTYSGGSFSLDDLEFADGIGSAIRQPYWRYAEKGMTLTPSATTGTGITLTTSADFFVAGHVGTRIRYLNNEIEITAVTNGTTATGTVITTLYPTITVPVTSVAPFKVGHAISGETSQVEGQVAAVGASSITVTLTGGYSYFDASEKIVSPEGSTTTTGASTATTPAASVIWDEQMISAVRGYPRCGVLHRNRLIIAGFPQAANAVAASAIDFETDFDLGSARDDEAFIVSLGDDQNAEIRHLVSAEQLVILTDRSCYYVPENEQSPLSPTRVSFLRISPDGSSSVQPVLAPEGVIFVDLVGRLLVISATGSIRASWEVGELSMLAKHLITTPVELCYVDGIDGRSERLIMVRNSDNSVATMSYRRGADQAGMSKWTPATGHNWKSFAAWKQQLYTIQGSHLARFSMNATCDLEADYSSAATILNGLDVYVLRSGIVWAGPLTVASGEVTGIAPAETYSLGLDFEVQVTPAPPVHQRIGHEERGITRMWLNVLDTGPYRCGNELRTGYVEDSDFEAPPPLMTGGSDEFYIEGYSTDDMPSVTQDVGEGAPLFIRSMTMEVSY
jgi:hypothetical protein